MATSNQLEMLTGKALLDPAFLEQLIDDPQGAANSVGISLTNDQVRKIQYFQENRKELLKLQAKLSQMRDKRRPIKPERLPALAW